MLTADYMRDMVRLVDQANKRLMRLERLAASDETYKKVTEFAYKYAQEDIKRLRKGGAAVRYQRPPARIPEDPKARRALEARLRLTEKSINRFLEAPSSTVKELRRIYKQRAKTFSEGFDAGAPAVSADDLVKVFESGLWNMLMQYYGSETTRRLIGEIKRNRNDLKELMEQGERIRLQSDKITDSQRLLNIDKINAVLDDPSLTDSGVQRGAENVRILSKYLRGS